MLKKIMLLSMALAAVMAFAGPALASASDGAIVDLDNGETAENDTSIPVAITFNFATALGGFSGCVAHATLTTTESPGGVQSGTADLTNIEVTTHTCVGGGALTGCTVEEATVPDVHLTVNGHSLTGGPVKVDGTNDANCGAAVGMPGVFENIDLDFPVITVTPAAGGALDGATLASPGFEEPEVGTATIVSAGGLKAEAVASGGIALGEAGTWGIETVE